MVTLYLALPSCQHFHLNPPHSHDVVLDLDEELLHGEDVVGDVERPDRDEEGRVVQADQLTQHLAPDLALNQKRRLGHSCSTG